MSPEEIGKRLAQSETNFRLLVEGVKDYAIFMLDPDGNVTSWNEGAQRIKGYTADEIIGQHFSIFYPQEAIDHRHAQEELAIARREGRYEEEGWRVRKDGSSFWASVVLTPLHDENDEIIGFAKVTRDLTERKILEEQREAHAKQLATTNADLQRALEAKGRFLSTISHEVRTPMSGIIGMTELLTLQDIGDDNNLIVRNIFDSSKRLLQMLNNVLDAARMEAGSVSLEYRKFPIRSVLGDVRQLVTAEADKKNLAVEGYCDNRLPEYVCGDEIRLRQVLLNLAFNAVKFTQSGRVNISCNLKVKNPELVAHFSVSDTGIGIKAEDLSKLFKPFSQADDSTKRIYGGTGLGLSISKDIVTLMGGEIGVESELGEGSTFWFDVPLAEGKCEI
jgi:osomolarity two-component system, sensor histidine kinase TcsA